jgi:hypothetical protein
VRFRNLSALALALTVAALAACSASPTSPATTAPDANAPGLRALVPTDTTSIPKPGTVAPEPTNSPESEPTDPGRGVFGSGTGG